MANKVDICGINTAEIPKLKAQEIAVLMKRLKTGDEDARQLFLYSNMRLVLSVVKRFATKRDNVDDIFQVGFVGLIKAMENFDENFNVKFSTYAVPMIIGEIRRFLRDNSPVRVSRSLRDTAYRALQARDKLSKGNPNEPNLDEIADEAGLKLREVLNALDAISEPISLFENVYNDSDESVLVMDQIKDVKNSSDEFIEHVALKEALNGLKSREKEILWLRYFLGKTQVEISSQVGISQAQVSRLEKNALEEIKKEFV
ncbi:MAG: SigB/SigF/SigG family RNA polymerase sigma factor [Clostridia bacterium]|nr:SigB/SigF/SigG family RNA polymerase sigma factor [Clostridia bacterium]